MTEGSPQLRRLMHQLNSFKGTQTNTLDYVGHYVPRAHMRGRAFGDDAESHQAHML